MLRAPTPTACDNASTVIGVSQFASMKDFGQPDLAGRQTRRRRLKKIGVVVGVARQKRRQQHLFKLAARQLAGLALECLDLVDEEQRRTLQQLQLRTDEPLRRSKLDGVGRWVPRNASS